MKKECVAMLLAGGQGSRLYVLTGNMAKPAVPFGGKFRIIDFPLSNCTNSGIDTVGVLTQYRPLELNSYIGSGQPWELDRMSGGVHILPPYQSATGAVWYKGTANAIYQNRGFVDLYDPEYVLVLSGDHIYKMDYSDMLRRHKEAGAACTISVMEVPWEEASRFGIMSVDEQDRITEFAEKPKEPKYLFLFSKNVQTLINFGITLCVFFVFCIIDNIAFTWKLILLVYPIVLLLLFNIGVGLILSALFVFFRDIQYLWTVFLQLLMYMSAIFYSIDTYEPMIRNLFLLNPMYLFIRYFRKIVIEATIPSVWFHLLMLADVAIVLGLGCLIYKKNNTKFLYYV